MKQTKITLFSNYELPSYEDYVEFCNDNEIEPAKENSNEFYNWVYDTQDMEWDDFMTNMKYSTYNKQAVVITGSVGTWQGRREIYPMFKDNLLDAIKKCIGSCDYAEVTQEDGMVFVSASHHDGTNSFTIRLLSQKGLVALNDYDDNDIIVKDLKDYYFKNFKDYVI